MVNQFSNQVGVKALKGQGWAPRWWGVLRIGLVLWIASLGSVVLTGDIIVLPTIVLRDSRWGDFPCRV